jgi:hypothetical protein
MPAVFRVISIVGTVAMLWVGGHLVIENLAETFWHGPHDVVHAITHSIEAAGPVVVWIVETACSAVFGLILGLVVVGVVMLVRRVLPGGSKGHGAGGHGAAGAAGHGDGGNDTARQGDGGPDDGDGTSTGAGRGSSAGR